MTVLKVTREHYFITLLKNTHSNTYTYMYAYICVYVCIYTHMFNGVRSPGLMVLFLLHLAIVLSNKITVRAWETSTVGFSQNINVPPKSLDIAIALYCLADSRVRNHFLNRSGSLNRGHSGFKLKLA